MTYTYTENAVSPTAEAFVPSYQRKTVKTKKVKTWMVLAPIAGVVLIGGAAAMLMNSGGESVQPLAEPAVAPAIVQPAPLAATPLSSTPVETMTAPAAVTPAPVPVARQAEPVRRAAPAPATTEAQAPVEPTGPRAYEAAPMTATPAPTAQAPSVVAPAPARAAPAPAPRITVQPL